MTKQQYDDGHGYPTDPAIRKNLSDEYARILKMYPGHLKSAANVARWLDNCGKKSK